MIVQTADDIERYLSAIRKAAMDTQLWIASQTGDPLDLLRRMKFETIGFHPIDGCALNVVEQINQTWTYTSSRLGQMSRPCRDRGSTQEHDGTVTLECVSPPESPVPSHWMKAIFGEPLDATRPRSRPIVAISVAIWIYWCLDSRNVTVVRNCHDGPPSGLATNRPYGSA